MTTASLTIAAQRMHFKGDGRPKVSHMSETAAVEHLERMVAASPRVEADVYRCPLCAGWHVGRVGVRRRFAK